MTFPTEFNIHRACLGNGVYACFDGVHVVLSAENGECATDVLYLDQSTIEALGHYWGALASRLEAKCLQDERA